MIEQIKKDGNIMAYCSWYKLTRHMQFDPRLKDHELELAFIDTFWKHKDYDVGIRDIIKQLTKQVLTKHKYLQVACYNRHRTNGNKSSRFYWYTRHQMLNATGKKERENGRQSKAFVSVSGV